MYAKLLNSTLLPSIACVPMIKFIEPSFKYFNICFFVLESVELVKSAILIFALAKIFFAFIKC